MFTQIDNIPNASLFNNKQVSLGNSNIVHNKPEPTCGCKHTFTAVSDNSNNTIAPSTIIPNGTSGYSVVSMSPEKYAEAFDEVEQIDPAFETLTNKQTAPQDHQYIPHLYVSALSVIGLFALYRIIHKTQ